MNHTRAVIQTCSIGPYTYKNVTQKLRSVKATGYTQKERELICVK